MTEAIISRALRAGLEAAGCFTWKANDSRTVGVPDIVGCTRDGKHLAIETKLIAVWPRRPESMALKHVLSRPQYVHLRNVANRRGLALIAIGCPPVQGMVPGSGGRVGCVLIALRTWERLASMDGITGAWPENVLARVLLSEISATGDAVACTGTMSSMFSPPAGLLG